MKIRDKAVHYLQAEPAFLAGQSSRSGVEVSPIKIVKNPDGSMQRAAMTQSALAKERRELKEQQQRTLLEAIPKDLSRHAGRNMPYRARVLAIGISRARVNFGRIHMSASLAGFLNVSSDEAACVSLIITLALLIIYDSMLMMEMQP